MPLATAGSSITAVGSVLVRRDCAYQSSRDHHFGGSLTGCGQTM
jgi:hypothetical protein